MQRNLSKLAVAITILALTGCVEDKPAPRPDSACRGALIGAAHAVNNGYAAPAPAAPTVNKPAEPPCQRCTPAPIISGGQPARDDPAIAGTWTLQADDLVYFRIFNADGTCKEAAAIVGPAGKLFFIYHTEGTYRLLPGNEIEVTVLTGPNERKVGKIKYRLTGDMLELKMDDQWLKFKRATQ